MSNDAAAAGAHDAAGDPVDASITVLDRDQETKQHRCRGVRPPHGGSDERRSARAGSARRRLCPEGGRGHVRPPGLGQRQEEDQKDEEDRRCATRPSAGLAVAQGEAPVVSRGSLRDKVPRRTSPSTSDPLVVEADHGVSQGAIRLTFYNNPIAGQARVPLSAARGTRQQDERHDKKHSATCVH